MGVAMLSMAEIQAQAQKFNIDFSQIDLSSIIPPLDFNPSIYDEEQEETDYLRRCIEEQEGEIKREIGYNNVIVVDHIPIVNSDKFEKLEKVIKTLFTDKGRVRVKEDDGLWIPVDPDTGLTRGYCFIEYETNEDAEDMKLKTHGFKLDRNHTLAVNFMDDFDRLMNVQDEWCPPETKPYTPGENLGEWLMDEKARNQFVIRSGPDTEVLWNTEVNWNDPMQMEPELVFRRKLWTENNVLWSPLGTYMTTSHSQGVVVSGGATTFNRLMRYSHPQVQLMDFSPGEKFLFTYSSHEPRNPHDKNRVVLKIFNVRSGKLMREFNDIAGVPGGVSGVSWPVFRWGGGKEDKYFARIGKNVISVFETDTFSLIDKKSLKIENVLDFSWSPSDPILAVFVPEHGGGNQPARVSLVQIPGKEELRQKNLFNVSECRMYWQSNGNYLAVEVERCTKTKKSSYTSFELFRIRERDIPIEVLELENKNDKVIAFAWEPNGHRFAVIHGDSTKPDISIYSMQTSRVSKLETLKGKQANALFWAPSGRYIVFAGLRGAFNGQLEFFDVDELESLRTGEHFNVTNIEWDPSGRYVATSSVHEMESGYRVWSFIGKLLYGQPRDQFHQFLWRPRPASYLTPEKEAEIIKDLKNYGKKYDVVNQSRATILRKEDEEKRRKVTEEWEGWVEKWRKLDEEEKMARKMLLDGEESDDEKYYEAKEVEVEEVIDVEEEEC
ncbi:Eukaryotic translation initiation factor 3 subunit B [Ranunculus cassubicifolius]